MAYRKLGRNSSARKALFRSILTSFFKQERIETTATKAKEISGLAANKVTCIPVVRFLRSSWMKKRLKSFLTKLRQSTLIETAGTLVFTSSDLVVAMQRKWLFWNWFNKKRLKLQRLLSLQFFYKKLLICFSINIIK